MAAAFDFPTSDRLGKEFVEKNFLRVSDPRGPDPAFHFATFVPKTWRPLDLPSGIPELDGGPVRLALYRPEGEDGQAIALDVAVVKLSREVDPAHWLDTYLESLGLMIVNGREAPAEGGNIPDRLTVNPDPANPQVARWLALKNGPNLFLIQGRATVDTYKNYADTFFLALSQFTLLHPQKWPLAESLGTFSRHDPGNFVLMVPESWERIGDPLNHGEFLDVRYLNAGGVGQLYFAAANRKAEITPEKMLADHLWGLLGTGIKPTKPPKLEKRPPLRGVPEMWECRFEAISPEGPLELRTCLGQRDEWVYWWNLISPPKAKQPSLWAINQRAFEILLKYFVAEPRGGVPA